MCFSVSQLFQIFLSFLTPLTCSVSQINHILWNELVKFLPFSFFVLEIFEKLAPFVDIDVILGITYATIDENQQRSITMFGT